MASTSTSNDRPRYRSSTIGSIQTLTHALRESLRLRKLRKKKRRNEANNEKMRRRSKSVGNASFDDEISEIGMSVVVASDIGPMMNIEERHTRSILQHRRQSKSADDVEMAQIKRKLANDNENGEKISDKNLSVNSCESRIRRRSKDDHDLPKHTANKNPHNYISEQKGFRKRFGQLFGSLRMKHQTHTQLQAETPSTSPSNDCEDTPNMKDTNND